MALSKKRQSDSSSSGRDDCDELSFCPSHCKQPSTKKPKTKRAERGIDISFRYCVSGKRRDRCHVNHIPHPATNRTSLERGIVVVIGIVCPAKDGTVVTSRIPHPATNCTPLGKKISPTFIHTDDNQIRLYFLLVSIKCYPLTTSCPLDRSSSSCSACGKVFLFTTSSHVTPALPPSRYSRSEA